MPRDIIDEQLIGALHLRALTLAGFEHDRHAERTAAQTGTIDALLAGNFEGDASVGDVLRLGDLGVGTLQQLDGELMLLDGEAWVARADGTIEPVADDDLPPFAVACRFQADATIHQAEPLDFDALRRVLDALAPADVPIVAIRARGAFVDLELRSVHRQYPPYPPLSQVVAQQTRWTVATSIGTLIGFRFPDGTSGVEVPGYHLHYLSDDRQVGGHVLSIAVASADIEVDRCDSLHVELPKGVTLGVPGATDRAVITALESAPSADEG